MKLSLRYPLLVALPLLAYLSSWYYNGQVIPLLALSSVLLLLWGATALWPRLGAGLPWPKGFLPVFMLVWFVWFWLTLFWSTEPYSSWFYFWTLGSLPLIFLVFIALPRDEREWLLPWLWWGVLALAWVLIAIALWEYFHAIAIHASVEGSMRVQGPLMDTNSFAAWINLIYFPVLFRYFHWDGQRRSRELNAHALFLLITLLFLTFAFWATYSRGGGAGLGLYHGRCDDRPVEDASLWCAHGFDLGHGAGELCHLWLSAPIRYVWPPGSGLCHP